MWVGWDRSDPQLKQQSNGRNVQVPKEEVDHVSRNQSSRSLLWADYCCVCLPTLCAESIALEELEEKSHVILQTNIPYYPEISHPSPQRYRTVSSLFSEKLYMVQGISSINVLMLKQPSGDYLKNTRRKKKLRMLELFLFI